MVVSVDAFKTSQFQKQGQRVNGGLGGWSQGTTYFQVVASVEARLVNIENNQVMWTGDLSTTCSIGNQDQDTDVLSVVAESAESIAKAFPPFSAPTTQAHTEQSSTGQTQ
jgi:hypothetical protein